MEWLNGSLHCHFWDLNIGILARDRIKKSVSVFSNLSFNENISLINEEIKYNNLLNNLEGVVNIDTQ